VTFLDPKDGLSIQAPSGWYFEENPVPNLLDPVVDLAVGSWRFPSAEGCGPDEALASIPADGVLVWIVEYRQSEVSDELQGMFDMDLLRASFSQESVQPECGSAAPSFVLYFRDGSRFFEVHAAYGLATGPADRVTALGIVRSLTVEDPNESEPFIPEEGIFSPAEDILSMYSFNNYWVGQVDGTS
jgi:hypothetical protein